METPPLLSLVIPCYNEEQRLPATLAKLAEGLPALGRSTEVVVADDGSTDATRQAAEAFKDRIPSLSVLALPHGGKGSALKGGIEAAQGQYVFLCDADLSMPLSELPKLMGPAQQGAPVVLGWRRRLGEPAFRRFRGRIFNLLVRALLLPGVHDTQTGFKLFRKDVALQVYAAQRIRGYASEVEILYVARRLGYKLAEARVDWYYEPGGKVRPVLDVLRMLRDLIKIRVWATRGVYPAQASKEGPTGVSPSG